ncbi:hypothetical protein [Gorillibacterium sp. sgz500922]
MGKKKSLKADMQSMADKAEQAETTKEHPTTNTNIGKFHQPNRPSV